MPTLDQFLSLMQRSEPELYERLIHSRAAFAFNQILLIAQSVEEQDAAQQGHEDRPATLPESE